MERFFINKFPLKYGGDKTIETGTIFTVTAVNGDFFELESLNKIKDLTYPLMFGPAMLDRGFTAQEHLET